MATGPAYSIGSGRVVIDHIHLGHPKHRERKPIGKRRWGRR